jgi:hypothetical protein
MTEEIAESVPAETTDDVATEPVEAEPTTTEKPEGEESAPSDDKPESQDENAAAPEAAKQRSDSEARASETAKKQAIEIRTLKRELRKVQEQVKTRPSETPKLVDPPEPELENYSDIDDFKRDHGEWKTKHDAYVKHQVLSERKAAETKESQEKQLRANQDAWTKKEAETKKRTPGYTNVQELYEEVQPSDVMGDFIARQEIGPDMIWHLRENPDIADRLRDIADPYQAVEELINLRNTLANQIKGIKPKAPATFPPRAVNGGSAGIPKPKALEDLLYR